MRSRPESRKLRSATTHCRKRVIAWTPNAWNWSRPPRRSKPSMAAIRAGHRQSNARAMSHSANVPQRSPRKSQPSTANAQAGWRSWNCAALFRMTDMVAGALRNARPSPAVAPGTSPQCPIQRSRGSGRYLRTRRTAIRALKGVLNGFPGIPASPRPMNRAPRRNSTHLTHRIAQAQTSPAAAHSAAGFDSPNTQGASSAALSMPALFSCPRVAGSAAGRFNGGRCVGSRKARRFLVAGLSTRVPSVTPRLTAPWRTPHTRSPA